MNKNEDLLNQIYETGPSGYAILPQEDINSLVQVGWRVNSRKIRVLGN